MLPNRAGATFVRGETLATICSRLFLRVRFGTCELDRGACPRRGRAPAQTSAPASAGSLAGVPTPRASTSVTSHTVSMRPAAMANTNQGRSLV